MVKSDTHMVKVKGRLLAEKKRIEEAEERKKARESKKIAKEVQVQKMKERVKKKKEDIESVKKWRKQRKDSGFPDSNKDGGDEMGFKFEEGSGFTRSKKKQQWVAPGDRSGGKSGKGLLHSFHPYVVNWGCSTNWRCNCFLLRVYSSDRDDSSRELVSMIFEESLRTVLHFNPTKNQVSFLLPPLRFLWEKGSIW